MRVEFHPTASEEFEAASAYYNNEVPGLGAGFISEVERISELIQEHPTIGQPIDEVFRSAVLVRFPFSVIYSVETDRIWIIAVAHQRRRPGYWRGRTDR
jgi:plasmid stabilization system protein ParE